MLFYSTLTIGNLYLGNIIIYLRIHFFLKYDIAVKWNKFDDMMIDKTKCSKFEVDTKRGNKQNKRELYSLNNILISNSEVGEDNLVKSPNVLATARKHFGCSKLTGVPLSLGVKSHFLFHWIIIFKSFKTLTQCIFYNCIIVNVLNKIFYI